MADGLLKDLRDAILAEVVTPERKMKRLAAYNELVSLEAELPSCSCCGIRSYPVKGGLERPLTQPAPPRQSEAARARQSYVVLPISDPRFERLKVTEAQRHEHSATRRYRTVLEHEGTQYHLYPKLVLPAPPGSAPGPGSEPHVVLCAACFSRLPRPKSTRASASPAAGSKRPRAGAESDMECDSSDSDSEPESGMPLPFNSVAAGHKYGQMQGLPPLSLIETAILAKVIPYGTIVKLKEWHGVSQRALTGQTICFPSDGAEAVAGFERNRSKTQFPFHSNETLAEHVRVSFVGPAGKAKDYIRVLMLPDAPLYLNVANVITWLRVLRQTHPYYADVDIPSKEELKATLSPLTQLILDQAQIVDDETARYMENAKIGTDIAGVRSVFQDTDEQNGCGDCGAPSPQLDGNSATAGQSNHGGHESQMHLNAAGVPDRLPLVMSDVVIIDGSNRDEDPDQLLLDALNATLKRPTSEDSEAQAAEPDGLFCRRSEDPVNEFENGSELLVCAFPHVFPFGVGVPRSSLSPKFTRYLMLHHSNAFANEPRLYFLLFNQLHRHTNCRSTSLRVKAQKKHIDAVTRVTKSADFMPRLEAANANPDSADAKRLLASLHPHIITLGAKAPYGPAARKASFNHFLAGMNRLQA